MTAPQVFRAADVIARAMRNHSSNPMLLAEALESAQLLQSPETARRLSEAECVERRLLALLPTEPREEYGLPNDLAASAAEWGAWQQVAEVLGVQLPYERPADEDPIRYTLTEQAEAEAPFTEARAAFMQMGRTPSLEGLRAELRIEGKPPLVGRYVGASMGRLHDVPGHEHLLAIDPRLIFEYGEEADA